MAHRVRRAGAGLDRDEAVLRLERLASLLDAAIRIPGTRFRIGLDPLLGLIPGVGDGLGALLSSHIIAEAARLGAPRATILRMVANVAIEALIGVVPVLGDLFDAAWRANQRNVALLRAQARNPRRRTVVDRSIVYGGLAVLVLALLGVAVGGILGVVWLGRELSGA
jgi:hypothetical protein